MRLVLPSLSVLNSSRPIHSCSSPVRAVRQLELQAFLTLACSSPGAIGHLPSRAENMGAIGLRGGSAVDAVALLVGVLLLLLLGGGGVAAASAERSLSLSDGVHRGPRLRCLPP